MSQSDGHKKPVVLEYCKVCGEPIKIRLPKLFDNMSLRDAPVICRCNKEQEEREAEARLKFERRLNGIRYLRESLMDEKGRAARFDKIIVTGENEKYINAAKRYCDRWVDNFKNGRGLLFYGGPGRGKTTLAFCIANRLLDDGVEVKAAGVNDLIQRVKGSFSDGENAEAQLKELVKNAELLILDDLGAEYKTEWSTSFIYDVIDARYRSERPTIITTNLTLQELKEHLSDRHGVARSFDRLTEMLTPVEFKLKNYRIEKARELKETDDFFQPDGVMLTS